MHSVADISPQKKKNSHNNFHERRTIHFGIIHVTDLYIVVLKLTFDFTRFNGFVRQIKSVFDS